MNKRIHKKESHSKEKGGVFLVEGESVLKEYVNSAPHLIEKVWFKDKKDELRYPQLSAKVSKAEYWQKPDGSPFRKPTSPIAALVQVPEFDSVDLLYHLKSKNDPLVVMLDHIQDARNLGAIARSLAFFGVSVLIIPNARQTGVTEFALSTSQGAFAHIRVFVVPNLARVCADLKEIGYWILGADMEGESVVDLVGFYPKNCLILGNEEKGISRLLREKCDKITCIPRKSGKLDSLNVSVAAGVLVASLSSR